MLKLQMMFDFVSIPISSNATINFEIKEPHIVLEQFGMCDLNDGIVQSIPNSDKTDLLKRIYTIHRDKFNLFDFEYFGERKNGIASNSFDTLDYQNLIINAVGVRYAAVFQHIDFARMKHDPRVMAINCLNTDPTSIGLFFAAVVYLVERN